MKYLPGVMNADWMLIPLHFASFPDHWLWGSHKFAAPGVTVINLAIFPCNENHRHKIYRFLFCITHYKLATDCRPPWYNLLKFLHRLCRVRRVSVLPIISCSPRTEQSGSVAGALNAGPGGSTPGLGPAPDSFHRSQIWNYFSIVCRWSFVRPTALRGLSEARKTRRCGGNYPGSGTRLLLCFTSPWSHAADDTATNPCVWERGKFYLTNFLSNISFNYQLRSTIQMSGYDKPML